MAGSTYSRANSSLASTTIVSAAPSCFALAITASQSSPGWPSSTLSVTTSASYCSWIQCSITEVSRPPE